MILVEREDVLGVLDDIILLFGDNTPWVDVYPDQMCMLAHHEGLTLQWGDVCVGDVKPIRVCPLKLRSQIMRVGGKFIGFQTRDHELAIYREKDTNWRLCLGEKYTEGEYHWSIPGIEAAESIQWQDQSHCARDDYRFGEIIDFEALFIRETDRISEIIKKYERGIGLLFCDDDELACLWYHNLYFRERLLLVKSHYC